MKSLIITLTVLISIAAAGLAEARPVKSGQSDASSSYSKGVKAVAQNWGG